MASRPAAAQPIFNAERCRALTDAELAEALRDGEAWATTEAWRRFAPMVRSATERALGSRVDSDDVVQETFIGVFRTVHRLREPERLRSFVYSVALRTLRSQLRYRRARSKRGISNAVALIGGPDLTFDLDSRELLRGLYDLLERLSARDRRVFILRRVEDMTVPEVAATLGLSGTTVKRSFSHASQRLSAWLAPDAALQSVLE